MLSPPPIEDLGVLWPVPLSNFLQLVQYCSAQKLIFTGLLDLIMKFVTIRAGLLILMIAWSRFISDSLRQYGGLLRPITLPIS